MYGARVPRRADSDKKRDACRWLSNVSKRLKNSEVEFCTSERHAMFTRARARAQVGNPFPHATGGKNIEPR